MKEKKFTPPDITNLDPRKFIIIKGARVNNLKNLSVAIPRNQLVVITGLSGSGKSSLAFDTLFAEGQRMYVESLSSYARQFLGRMEKPEVDYIRGVSPAIAVEQKGNSKNPRATVGTTTEIYDYLKLFFARIGVTYSPITEKAVKKDTVTDVVNYIHTFEDNEKLMILSPIQINNGRSIEEELKVIFQKGFSRIIFNDELVFIEDFLADKKKLVAAKKNPSIFILIDRNIVKKDDEDNQFRIADSVQTAFYEGHGICVIDVLEKEKKTFSDKFEADGMSFEEPSIAFFSFNNPYGACKRCNGFGNILAIDENLVIQDRQMSVYEGVVVPWTTDKMSEWQKDFIKKTAKLDFPIHRSYEYLTEEEKDLLWNGGKGIEGINQFFAYVESQSHKIQYRVMFSRYRGKITCPDCKGTKLRKDAGYVKINGQSIIDLALMSMRELIAFFENLQLTESEQKVAKRLLVEINNRLKYLDKVGLGYLTLNRLTASLSGGEYQRIKLATALGSALVGSMYILDEPSIGLHPRDTARLISVLKDLKDMGNTVIIVEHEEEVMREADQIIDIGPDAGTQGGELVFQGNWDVIKNYGLQADKKSKGNSEKPILSNSHTINFLTGQDVIEIPKQRRAWADYIEVKGARENNLKNLDVKFPLGVLTVVTGVSGSGKSTLVTDILYPALARLFQKTTEAKARFDRIEGSLNLLAQVEYVDQNPIGKSSRSNPATYTKVYDSIRQLFTDLPLAKSRAYEPSHFSFNVDKGRCEVCQGEGTVKIEMQFMADIHLKCESCNGKRFKKEILEIVYNEKNIADILDMTVDDAVAFFEDKPKIINTLNPLAEVGLGYVRLGQSSNTLSGGEAQRLKLATFLDKKTAEKSKTLFIFDEPTTGLHFNDIKKLLKAFNALIEQGNTVLVIEHNLEVIKSADWIIDLGLEGGDKGGNLCFEGTPEDIIKTENNYTGFYLKDKF